MPVQLTEAKTNALREKHTRKATIIRMFDGTNGWEPAKDEIGHNELKYKVYSRGLYRVYMCLE